MNRESKELSPLRRWSRILAWACLGIVLVLRFRFPEWWEAPKEEPQFQPARAQFEGRRWYRPPTPIAPPVSPVPADLWRLHIEIAPRDVEVLRQYHWHDWRGRQEERPEVVATVRENGVVYSNVALHLKGSAGSFRSFDDKPALTLNFSKHVKNQLFHGYKKISLNNSVQDPSYLCEIISRELFEAAGVPVPRAGHATVLINGRDLGLYVFTEGFGKPFLKRYFDDVSGNLYDGGFCQEISPYLHINSGDHRDDHAALEKLIAAASAMNATNQWERLNECLDMEKFLSFLAMEIMTCHWDGYGMNQNNYRLFHNRETDRFVFIPHGLDQMFGVMRSWPSSPIDEPMRGLVARAVMSLPEGRKAVFDRIATLRTNVFRPEEIDQRIQELAQKIRPTLAAYSPAVAREHDRHVADLRRRVAERAQSISEQLAAPPDSQSFDTDGVLRLSGWQPRIETARGPGRPRFRKIPQPDGTTWLHLTAPRGGGVVSWRTRVRLEAGRYRFEGLAKASGIGFTGGICLRTSAAEIGIQPIDDRDWAPLQCDMRILDPLAEIELICELRAATGEAWFDADSLRLIRQ